MLYYNHTNESEIILMNAVEKQEKLLNDFEYMLTSLRTRQQQKRYCAFSRIGSRIGHRKVERQALIRYNAKLGYRIFSSDSELQDCINEFVLAMKEKNKREQSKFNNETFAHAKASQRYSAEHKFDKPNDLSQLGLATGAPWLFN